MNKDIIQNKFLKESFDAYVKISSEEEKKAHQVKFANDFDNLSEAEQETVRQAWLDDMFRVKERLDAIADRIGVEKRHIEPPTFQKEEHPVLNKL